MFCASSALSWASFSCGPAKGADTAPADGQLAFWTNCSTCGTLQVSVDNAAVGTLTQALSTSSTPTCGTAGTLTLTETEGTYAVSATSTTGTVWPPAEVEVEAPHCTVFEFIAPSPTAGHH